MIAHSPQWSTKWTWLQCTDCGHSAWVKGVFMKIRCSLSEKKKKNSRLGPLRPDVLQTLWGQVKDIYTRSLVIVTYANTWSNAAQLSQNFRWMIKLHSDNCLNIGMHSREKWWTLHNWPLPRSGYPIMLFYNGSQFDCNHPSNAVVCVKTSVPRGSGWKEVFLLRAVFGVQLH